jgi:hypothetical protein
VQKLALMMAVMMLGMPPVNGYHAGMEPEAQGDGGRMEPKFCSPAQVEVSAGAPVAEAGVKLTALHGVPPVEPGGLSALRILQQVQLGMESLSKIKKEIQEKGMAVEKTSERKEWNPGSKESGQEDRPRRDAAQKAMDALKKGADATRGRGRRKGRMYQRAGIRN